jgi:cysteine-rich repeat protein
MKHVLVALMLVGACSDGGSDIDDAICGDSFVQGTEQCDDGNNASGDGCSASCMSEPRCGDRAVQGTEQCDDGNTTNGDGCSATCALECGNGVKEPREQCDDGDTTSGDGCSATCMIEAQFTIGVTAFLRDYAGTTQSCPTGYDTVALYSQMIDSNGADVGVPIVDLFSCPPGGGSSGPLFEGPYKVHVAIMNSNGTMTYATTPTRIINLHENTSFTATIYTDAGYFAWAWQLVGAVSNNMLTCAQANSGGVELVSTLTSSTMALSDVFSCEAGHGITAALPAGTYTVSASVLDMSSQAVGTAPALTNKQIMAPNKVTDLGTVMIPVDGK